MHICLMRIATKALVHRAFVYERGFPYAGLFALPRPPPMLGPPPLFQSDRFFPLSGFPPSSTPLHAKGAPPIDALQFFPFPRQTGFLLLAPFPPNCRAFLPPPPFLFTNFPLAAKRGSVRRGHVVLLVRSARYTL